MANIKVGDKVVCLGVFENVPIVKTVKGIAPKTIALVDRRIFEGREIEFGIEPKQHPEAWRIYDESKVNEMAELSKQIQALIKQLRIIYHSLPKITLEERK